MIDNHDLFLIDAIDENFFDKVDDDMLSSMQADYLDENYFSIEPISSFSHFHNPNQPISQPQMQQIHQQHHQPSSTITLSLPNDSASNNFNAFSPMNSTITTSFSLKDAPSLDANNTNILAANHLQSNPHENIYQMMHQDKENPNNKAKIFNFNEIRSFSLFGYPSCSFINIAPNQSNNCNYNQDNCVNFIGPDNSNDIVAPTQQSCNELKFNNMKNDLTPEKNRMINVNKRKSLSDGSNPKQLQASDAKRKAIANKIDVDDIRIRDKLVKSNKRDRASFDAKSDDQSSNSSNNLNHNKYESSGASNKYSRGSWSASEDDLLKKLVNAAGSHLSWKSISSKIKTRNAKQCRERWTLNLDPNIYHGPFTPEEDDLLLQLHSRIGSKWTKIKTLLPGRTENSVKTRYKSLVRKYGKLLAQDDIETSD